MKNLTPEHMRCPYADCSSIHELDDGRLLIVGEYVSTTELRHMGANPVGDAEAAIIIERALLANVAGELPRLAVDQLKECIETIRVLSQERDRLRGALELILDGAQTQGADMSDGRAITGMTWVDVEKIARAAIDGQLTPVSQS